MPEVQQYTSKPTVLTTTIASSGTTSGALVLYGTTPVLVEMPAAITGTSLTFEGSIDGGTTFVAVKNYLGASITYVVAASGVYTLDPADFVGFDQIKLVMASQGAERTIKVKCIAI